MLSVAAKMEEMGAQLEEEQTFLNETANRGRLAAERDAGLERSPPQASQVNISST